MICSSIALLIVAQFLKEKVAATQAHINCKHVHIYICTYCQVSECVCKGVALDAV